jgi:hypothetical protein
VNPSPLSLPIHGASLGTAILVCASLVAQAGIVQDLRLQHEKLGIVAAHDSLRKLGQEPGQGLRIAVIDDGFSLRHKGLSRLQSQGIVDSWDYQLSSPSSWDTIPRFSHGSATLGVLASTWDSLPGVIPAARWMLYRSEVGGTERLDEERWLAQAIDRATDSGASVISISLGYRFYFEDSPNFPWRSMDGATHASSLAATRAARRGVVVVVAMGNDHDTIEGSPTLGAPADAADILSIGAVDDDGTPCGFSSTGPTSDGRIKPDLVGFGCPVPLVDASSDTGMLATGGTSFATPMIAGVVALARQLHPEWNPAQVIAALKGTASQGTSPDSKRGWGLPDLRKLPASLGIADRNRHSPVWSLSPHGQFLSSHALEQATLELWDVAGRKLSSTRIERLPAGKALSLGLLPRGLVVARLQCGTVAQSRRLLIP